MSYVTSLSSEAELIVQNYKVIATVRFSSCKISQNKFPIDIG